MKPHLRTRPNDEITNSPIWAGLSIRAHRPIFGVISSAKCGRSSILPSRTFLHCISGTSGHTLYLSWTSVIQLFVSARISTNIKYRPYCIVLWWTFTIAQSPLYWYEMVSSHLIQCCSLSLSTQIIKPMHCNVYRPQNSPNGTGGAD